MVLARILTLGLVDGTQSNQPMQIEVGSIKQQFNLEPCLAEDVEVADADGNTVHVTRFSGSGRQMPKCNGTRVLALVSRTSLTSLGGSIYATMDAAAAVQLRTIGGKVYPWVTQEHLDGCRELDPEIRLLPPR